MNNDMEESSFKSPKLGDPSPRSTLRMHDYQPCSDELYSPYLFNNERIKLTSFIPSINLASPPNPDSQFEDHSLIKPTWKPQEGSFLISSPLSSKMLTQ